MNETFSVKDFTKIIDILKCQKVLKVEHCLRENDV